MSERIVLERFMVLLEKKIDKYCEEYRREENLHEKIRVGTMAATLKDVRDCLKEALDTAPVVIDLSSLPLSSLVNIEKKNPEYVT